MVKVVGYKQNTEPADDSNITKEENYGYIYTLVNFSQVIGVNEIFKKNTKKELQIV